MKRSRENQSSSQSQGRTQDQSPGVSRIKSSEDNTHVTGEGGFIGRWARRKRDATIDAQEPVENDLLDASLMEKSGHALQGDQASADLSNSAKVPEAELTTTGLDLTASELTDEDMPDIETLNADSDFSPFFSKGVSKELRNLALKKLFFSGKFSARDGLDDYDDDFTKFEPLGDTVTSDMKFHARRKEKARLAALEEEQLKLEAAQTECREEQPNKHEQEAKVVDNKSTADADLAEVASVEDSKQDDQSQNDAASLPGTESNDNKIAAESVTETALHKDKEPHV